MRPFGVSAHSVSGNVNQEDTMSEDLSPEELEEYLASAGFCIEEIAEAFDQMLIAVMQEPSTATHS